MENHSTEKVYAEPLASAIKGDRTSLSKEGREQIKELMHIRHTRFIWELFKAWFVIIGSISVALYVDNIFVTILAIFLVATRQNVLALMMHDQVHYLGIKHKYGDLITDLFACYPLIILSVKNYAQVHLTHHKHFLTDQDPDFLRKSGRDWIFPMEHKQLLMLFVKDLLGLSVIQTFRGKNIKDTNIRVKRLWEIPKWVKPLYLFTAALIITLTGTWHIVALYWLLPLFTIFQMIVRWGAIREHRYIHNGSIEETTPLIINPFWEELIMPSKNFVLHIYHHYYAAVPFYNLRKVHEIYVKEGLVNEDNVFNGSLDYLKSIMADRKARA